MPPPRARRAAHEGETVVITARPLAAGGGTAAVDAPPDRGAHPASIMGCADRHMPRDATGAATPALGLSGGMVGSGAPGFGVTAPPNLTDDPTGLGRYDDAQAIAMIRDGIRPDG
jgi:hypothetical protein